MQTTQDFFFTAVPVAPTIEFEEASYQVREPPGPEGLAVLNIKVVRRGDQNRTSKVRCSTRDGSAQAGVDYYPKSRMLKFSPGKGFLDGRSEVMAMTSAILCLSERSIEGKHSGDVEKATSCMRFATQQRSNCSQ